MTEAAKESTDLIKEKIQQLKQIIPECFTEGKIDIEKLNKTLGKSLDVNEEKYGFGWAGRNDTFKIIQTTSKGSLVSVASESINFDKTKNLFIEGDNLEVLKLLQKSYFEKIKLVYIDPPYNTGNDFIYKDDFKNSIQYYLEQTGQVKGGIKLTTNPETSGRFHSDWISFMYARLFVVRNLLKEDGAIFVSIDDNEVHNLKMILNEIFGEENFIAQIVWQKKFSRQSDAQFFSDTHEYLLLYAKNKSQMKINLLPRTEKQDERYTNLDNDLRGSWSPDNLVVKTYSRKYDYEITTPSGRKVNPPQGFCWRISKERLQELIKDNRIWFGPDGKNVPRLKRFLSEVKEGLVPITLWLRDIAGDTQEAVREFKELMPDSKFDNPKPVKLLKLIITTLTSSESEDIIIDFFAGSGTTAHAVLEKNYEDGGNRKFICVQFPETATSEENGFNEKYPTIAEIAKERIRRVIKKMNELQKQKKLVNDNKQDLGFKVFKLTKSNFRLWESIEEKDVKKLKEQMKLFESPLISDFKDTDVIYECMIKEGFNLNSRIEKLDIKSNKVYKVSDEEKFFYITFDKSVNLETLEKINFSKDDTFICIDAALDDSKKTNLAKQCILKTL